MNQLFEELKEIIPGGVDGNAKTFSGDIPVMKSGEGAYLYDINDKKYIDYVSGYGPLLFGHGNPEFLYYLEKQMKNGILFGFPHELMKSVAKKIIELVPSAEMVRFTNTGTEATLNALRLAKGITGRDKIIKFYGAYHGTHDFVLLGTKISADTVFPHANADSAGITKGVQNDIYTLEFNDTEGFKQFMNKHGNEIAAVIVEPILGSYGISANKGFLEVLRTETTKFKTMLIFDEIITGLRLGLGGAQEYYNVIPDITSLGKVLGGGLPIGVFTGKKEYMQRIAPNNKSKLSNETIYHSGTFNSNPLSLAASEWVLTQLCNNPTILQDVNEKTDTLRKGFQEVMDYHNVKGVTVGQKSIFQWYFGIEKEPKNLSDLKEVDTLLQQSFHQEIVELGVLFIGSPRGFVSYAHSEDDIKETIKLVEKALVKAIKKK